MGPVNLMESLYFSKMVPNYRLSKVFLSCYHIFSDYSMPLQKKKKNKQRHKQTRRKRKWERYSPWGSDFTVIFKECWRSMEDSSLAPFAVQCSKVQRRKKKQSSKMLVLNLFLAVSVSFLFFFPNLASLCNKISL